MHSTAVCVDPILLTLGATGGPGTLVFLAAFLLVEVELHSLTHSGTALNGARCDVNLFLTASGTALTDGPPMLILALFDCSHHTKCHRRCASQSLREGIRLRCTTLFIEKSVDETQRVSLTGGQATQSSRKHGQGANLVTLTVHTQTAPPDPLSSRASQFTVHLDPPPLLHSLLLLFSVHFLHFFGFTFCVVLSQVLRKLSSCMALTSVFQHVLLLVMFHNSFCAMKPSTSSSLHCI